MVVFLEDILFSVCVRMLAFRLFIYFFKQFSVPVFVRLFVCALLIQIGYKQLVICLKVVIAEAMNVARSHT